MLFEVGNRRLVGKLRLHEGMYKMNGLKFVLR